MTKQIENVDGERSHFNIDYCNENIKKVYHKLFDEALQRYNEKQTRSDRRIDNYYEKIRNSKQEKPWTNHNVRVIFASSRMFFLFLGSFC